MFKNMTLGKKLLVSFLAVGVIPFAFIGITSLHNASDALSKQAFNQLQGVREIKKGQITQFFAERKGDMGVLTETVDALRTEAFAKLEAIQEIKKAQLLDYFETMKGQLHIFKDDPYVLNALIQFDEVFKQAGNKVSTPEWNALAKKHDSRFKDIMKDNRWYDLFLIHADGNIVYTAAREPDLGMSITESELKDSNLGKAFKAAQSMAADDLVLADIAPYSPSGGAPAGFMMGQLRDDSGTLKGYVAFQIPLNKINEIMLRRQGMGKTGESYLVGQDGLMRSDSFLDQQGHSVAASFKNNTKVSTEATKQALAGNENQDVIIDYNGNPVLSCWDALDLGSGVRWAMMSEMDVAEAFSPVDEKGEEFYKKYTQVYGYYDLFLVDPTVEKMNLAFVFEVLSAPNG
jgi:methyl-accepting chemotaxis protein